MQFAEHQANVVVERRAVEIVGKETFLLSLIVGICHPRCLVEHDVLKFLILLQTAQQTCLFCLTLPLFERCLSLRSVLQDVVAYAAGIICRGKTYGVVVAGGAYVRQSLKHEPCRIVGVFNRQFVVSAALSEQIAKVYRLLAGLRLCERHRIGYKFLVSQYRKIVLLAVAEVASVCKYLAHKH